jgi:hypothetical protein
MSVLLATSELGDIAAIVARTSLSYDLLPYASNPFPRTQPSHLAAIARLFGLDSILRTEALSGLATICVDPVRAAASAGGRPHACPLGRADAGRGDCSTANLRHEHVGLDGLAQLRT